jgi:hypothetical protein
VVPRGATWFLAMWFSSETTWFLIIIASDNNIVVQEDESADEQENWIEDLVVTETTKKGKARRPLAISEAVKLVQDTVKAVNRSAILLSRQIDTLAESLVNCLSISNSVNRTAECLLLFYFTGPEIQVLAGKFQLPDLVRVAKCRGVSKQVAIAIVIVRLQALRFKWIERISPKLQRLFLCES